MHFSKLKFNNLTTTKNLFFLILFTVFLFPISTISLGQNSDKNKLTYSFFGETFFSTPVFPSFNSMIKGA